MILRGNLPRIFERASRAERVLDVGGWWSPLNLATHVLDHNPYENRHQHAALDPEHPQRFTAATWTQGDACKAPWPYPDKFFDFSFCSQTLEDLPDPHTVSAELVRVSKAGYIETPTRAREIFCKQRFYGLRAAVGRRPVPGEPHHRWYVEIEGQHVRFLPKDAERLGRHSIITRGDLGRKMTEAESGAFLFWDGGFEFETAAAPDAGQLIEFRDKALARLRSDEGRRIGR